MEPDAASAARRAVAQELRALDDLVALADADQSTWATLAEQLHDLRIATIDEVDLVAGAAAGMSRFNRSVQRSPEVTGRSGDTVPLVHPLSEGSSAVFPAITWDLGDAELAAVVQFGAGFEGAPGLVHGGFIAAGFDIVLSTLGARVAGQGVTRRLNLRFMRPTFLHEQVRFEVRVADAAVRIVPISGRLFDASGAVTVRCDGEFVAMAADRFADRRSTMGLQDG